MYDFAVVALLALAVIKLVDFIADNVGPLERFRSLLIFAGGIVAVWLLDYSLFDGFGVAIRDRAMGVWITGFMVAGLTVPWRALFGWLTHDKAEKDETLGERVQLFGSRKAA
ncbi:MAG: hypothetical protein ACRD0U_08595 [Acidimicrobiales bacterium]